MYSIRNKIPYDASNILQNITPRFCFYNFVFHFMLVNSAKLISFLFASSYQSVDWNAMCAITKEKQTEGIEKTWNNQTKWKIHYHFQLQKEKYFDAFNLFIISASTIEIALNWMCGIDTSGDCNDDDNQLHALYYFQLVTHLSLCYECGSHFSNIS